MIATRLRALRIFVGALFLVRTTPLLFLVPGLRENHGGPLFGWPDGELRAGLGGVVLPVIVIQACVVLRTVAGVAFLLGVYTRAAGIAAAFLGWVVWSQEPFSFIFTVHALYLSVALLALTDVRYPESSVALLRAFVVSIYAWSAIAKLHRRWLDGTVLRTFYEAGHAKGAVADLLLGTDGRRQFAAWTTPVVELSLVVLLVVPKLRVPGIVLACIMHAIFELTVHPDVFGWLVVGLLVVFWPARDHFGMPCRQ